MSNSDFVTDFDAFTAPVLVAGAVSVKKRILMGLFCCFVLFLLYLWYQNGFSPLLTHGALFSEI